jgi:hypothetical protein
MNYLGLCQRVLDEADNVRWAMTSVTPGAGDPEIFGKVASWVKRAYRDVQQWSRFFTFHLREGTLFTTVIGQSDYTNAGVRKLLPGSLFALDGNAKWEMDEMAYSEWLLTYRTMQLANGVPQFVVPMQSGQFRVVPTPDRVLDVKGTWYTPIDELSADGDEPIWDEEDHEIVVWQALSYYISEYEVPELLAQRVQEALRNEKREFLMKYLPEFEQ